MLDRLISGGSVIDGTGAPARRADVGIRDGRIVAVGEIAEDARETITYERRKKHGPQPFLEHLPREIRKHELPPEERQYTCCGEEMTALTRA